MNIDKRDAERWWQILMESLGIKERPQVLTIHLPPPPADKWIWFGCIGVLIYEN